MTEQIEETTEATEPAGVVNDYTSPEPADDELATLPAERLAAMVRDKRKSEASYRTQLRDAEAERDRLSESVQGFQRQAWHETAKEAGVLPGALDDLDGHTELSSVLGESGLLDSDKAASALGSVKESKPHWFEQPQTAGQSGGDFAGSSGEPTTQKASWADVI